MAIGQHAPMVSGEEERINLTKRQNVLAVLPLVVLGFVAVICFLNVAEWRSEGTSELSYLGSSEESASHEAVATAAAIDPDAVNSTNPAVDQSIMKEVEQAEKEQDSEMRSEAAFASGKDIIGGDSVGLTKAKA